MWNNKIEQTLKAVTCPCCGLNCDDLIIELNNGHLKSIVNGCDQAHTFYNTAFNHTDPSPRIDGQVATLDEALEHGAILLRQANSPLFAGLATDVNGMRSTLALADQCGATLDHLNGDAIFRNLRVVQDNGWFTTTFTEVRNRADLVLLLGSQSIDRFPRLLERVLHPKESLFTAPENRKIVTLGPWQHENLPREMAQLNPTVITTDIARLPDIVGLLRGLIAGKPVDPHRLGESLGDALKILAEQLQAAQYSVIAWSAAEFDMPQAELAVLGLVELAKELNTHTRSTALPLAGSQGDITTNQVCTWQLGYPLRTRLQRGYPEHDPLLYRWQDLIERGESDLLLWISALSPDTLPPATGAPIMVLGHAGMKFATPPSLYIPIGVPSIDHQGHWYRSDGVCSLPLGKLRDSGLQSVSQIVNQLIKRLETDPDEAGGASIC
jgi:formylmethanofuran dehydrogenase subunit B